MGKRLDSIKLFIRRLLKSGWSLLVLLGKGIALGAKGIWSWTGRVLGHKSWAGIGVLLAAVIFFSQRSTEPKKKEELPHTEEDESKKEEIVKKSEPTVADADEGSGASVGSTDPDPVVTKNEIPQQPKGVSFFAETDLIVPKGSQRHISAGSHSWDKIILKEDSTITFSDEVVLVANDIVAEEGSRISYEPKKTGEGSLEIHVQRIQGSVQVEAIGIDGASASSEKPTPGQRGSGKIDGSDGTSGEDGQPGLPTSPITIFLGVMTEDSLLSVVSSGGGGGDGQPGGDGGGGRRTPVVEDSLEGSNGGRGGDGGKGGDGADMSAVSIQSFEMSAESLSNQVRLDATAGKGGSGGKGGEGGEEGIRRFILGNKSVEGSAGTPGIDGEMGVDGSKDAPTSVETMKIEAYVAILIECGIEFTKIISDHVGEGS